MALTLISLSLLLGVFLDSAAGLLPVVVPATVVLFVLVSFVRRYRIILLVVFCLIALILGAMRFDYSHPVVDDYNIAKFNDGVEVAVRGTVYRDPEVSGKTLRLYVRVTEKSNGWSWYENSGNVLIFVSEYAGYRYGDVLEITGKPLTPPKFDDFDYRGYLAGQQIYTTMLYPKISVTEQGKGSTLLSVLYDFRRSLAGSIARSLPEPQAALANGIILGVRGGIPAAVKGDFTDSGTSHILAISGANLSIVAALLMGVFTWIFGKRHGIYVYLTLGVIWGYSILTGFDPPVVRSVIMASLFLAAELLGRQKGALPALAFSVAVMALVDPYVIWDVSFQLSFMAMTGLILIYPPFETAGRNFIVRLFSEKSHLSGIAAALTDSIGMSLAATIAVFPLVVNYFGVFSLAGLPATMLALPSLPVIIVTGAMTAIAGLVSPVIAQFTGYIAWLPLSYLLEVIKLMADIPYSRVAVPTLNAGYTLGYYAIMAIALLVVNRYLARWQIKGMTVQSYLTNTHIKWLGVPLALVVIAGTFVSVSQPDEKLHVSFLDVGQGDAILIQQGTHEILIDGGPGSQSVLNMLGREMPFWDRDIDLVVLTHPDADHVTGLIEVMKRYRIGKVLYPDLDLTSQAGVVWLAAVKDSAAEQVVAKPGQRIDIEDDTIEIILPERPPDDDTVDARSLSLRVSKGKVSFLLTADITSATEEELILERANLSSTVLKVPHHGSSHGTSAGFLDVVDPAAAVISVGKDNNFGHPALEVMERLEAKVGKENIYRTDENGTVEFTTDGEKLWMEKEK